MYYTQTRIQSQKEITNETIISIIKSKTNQSVTINQLARETGLSIYETKRAIEQSIREGANILFYKGTVSIPSKKEFPIYILLLICMGLAIGGAILHSLIVTA
jgi:hypothetical protein